MARSFRLRRIKALAALALMAIGAAGAPAHATVNSVNANPTAVNVTLTGPTTFTVTWIVQRSGAAPLGRVFSNQGQFVIGGTVVDTINRVLSRPSAGGTETVVFSEVVTVPRAAAIRAARAGGQNLRYVRLFNDLPGSADAVQGALALALTGPGSAGFSVSGVRLHFLDPPEARVAVVVAGSELRPVARVDFNGSGFLTATWTVADPSSTPGRAIPVSRRIVRKFLTAGGEVEIVGPPLPTDAQGAHVVRFEVTEPAVDFGAAALEYFVSADEGAALDRPAATIVLTSPRPVSALDAGTTVAWLPVPNVDQYQVIFFEAPEPPPAEADEDARYGEAPRTPPPQPGASVAGFFLPSDETAAPVPPLSIARLESGRRYYLQVVGRDAAGRVVGRSDLRPVVRR